MSFSTPEKSSKDVRKRLGFETVAIGRVECGKDKGEGKNASGCQTLVEVTRLVPHPPM